MVKQGRISNCKTQLGLSTQKSTHRGLVTHGTRDELSTLMPFGSLSLCGVEGSASEPAF